MYIKITSQMNTGNGLDPQKWYHYQDYYLILQEKRTQVNGFHDRDTCYHFKIDNFVSNHLYNKGIGLSAK